MCRHGQPAVVCPFCVISKLEDHIAELEYKLARRDEVIEEKNGAIDGLMEKLGL